MKKLIVLMLLIIPFVFALPTVEQTYPNDDFYYLRNLNPFIHFIANATPSTVGNISNFTLYTNISGSWTRNFTYRTNMRFNTEVEKMFNSSDTSINASTFGDNFVFIWNVLACDNLSSTNCTWGVNKTVYVENAPTITQTSPATGAKYKTNDITFNITIYGDDSKFICYLYSNDTGTFRQDGSFEEFVNNTATLFSREILDSTSYWNMYCFENVKRNVIRWGTNYTITTDTVLPIISIISPEDNAYSNGNFSTGASSGTINLTVTETNDDACLLYINSTINQTKTYTTDNFLIKFNASDNPYGWFVSCNDSAGNVANTTSRLLTIDILKPSISQLWNYSTSSCTYFTQEFNFTEASNISYIFTLDNTSFTNVSISSYSVNQTPNLTFNNNYEKPYFYNATYCDRAGNCRVLAPTTLMQIVTPIPLCTGWSIWSIYDARINLSKIALASGADYISFFNKSDQTFITYSDADTTYGNFNVSIGNAVWFYESTNSTYFRNITGTPSYLYNVSMGHNFLPLYTSYNFWNLTYAQFKNFSGGNITPQGKAFNVEYFSSYNNSIHTWVSTIAGWAYNNLTHLGVNPKDGLDTLWFYSWYNISLNMTTNGQVYGNWT